VPQKTVPLDLEPKQILLNNNTAKSKNSNPTTMYANSEDFQVLAITMMVSSFVAE